MSLFLRALPVYPVGKSTEMNTHAVFRAKTASLSGVTLRVTAFSFYRVTVNGAFAGFGPARTAGGYARADLIPLDAFDSADGNEIVIEVSGYCCRSLSTVRQPSFLQAELVRGGTVLAATGQGGFEAFLPGRRIQKTERYSFQRHFTEVWDLSVNLFQNPVPTEEIAPAPVILPRVAPVPHSEEITQDGVASSGILKPDPAAIPHRDFYSEKISDRWGRFAREEIDTHPYEWIQTQTQEKRSGAGSFPLRLSASEYAILDLHRIEAGFLHLLADVTGDADVVIAFSEDGSPDRFAYTDMHVHNAIEVRQTAGDPIDLLSIEPYTVRYAMVAVRSGEIVLRGFGIRTWEADLSGARIPSTGDPVLDGICLAAARTYAHNAVDLYTDCPSRERAGWLCDTYFTARTEYALFGKVPTEAAFLENYRLFCNDGSLPEGVLPMCYPSDTEDSNKFIPQWTMWYILEVGEYLDHRAPDADRELFRPSVEGLLAFYRRYENADGLLEKLPSWNFVEWSVANQWTHDVNYPTNFLYAAVLDAAYRLYGDPSLPARAEQVRRAAREQSFDGRVFLDHAIRDENGVLVRQPHCSEAGQYYAILFGDPDLTDPKYAELLRLIRSVFGPVRKEECPDIAPINAFIGAYLRLDVLLKLKEYDLLRSDVADFFGQMNRDTGTLWEYRERHGSRDHGFASYTLAALSSATDPGRQSSV